MNAEPFMLGYLRLTALATWPFSFDVPCWDTLANALRARPMVSIGYRPVFFKPRLVFAPLRAGMAKLLRPSERRRFAVILGDFRRVAIRLYPLARRGVREQF